MSSKTSSNLVANVFNFVKKVVSCVNVLDPSLFWVVLAWGKLLELVFMHHLLVRATSVSTSEVSSITWGYINLSFFVHPFVPLWSGFSL